MALEAAIQGAAAEPQRAGRQTDVALMPGEGLLDEHPLHLLQRHVFQGRCHPVGRFEVQVAGAHLFAPGQQDRSFDRMVQLTDVAGPGV